ncbi:MAG: glycyl-radical enzyme activating protein [Ruminococcaceae bacterium]|nr:glycyl-radical enzyme activating protein [Oscillospiraceae bacterium]
MTGDIFDIAHASLVDGPGIRTAVFFKGCNLKCAWCHNPESQSFSSQLLFYEDLCTHCGSCRCEKEKCDLCGRCALLCPRGAKKLVGRAVTVQEVMDEILTDTPFYGSEGGATFTGGECMLQPEFLTRLLKACKENTVHTAVDTAGNVPWKSFEAILPYTDLFLYDVKLMDDAEHKAYTGAGNRLILENLGKLLDSGANVWVRIPVIGGVNDTDENFTALKAFLKKHKAPQRVDLLPYHKMGEKKYSALNMELTEFTVPTNERISYLQSIL